MNPILNWETLDHGTPNVGPYHVGRSKFHVWRSKIPGGWLVCSPDGLTFVPDPEHKWDGNSLP